MLYLIEISNNTYDDTWKMTFYYVLALAILIGLLWTVYKEYQNEKKASKTNVIYDKSFDAIEEIDLKKKSKNNPNNEITNYYDVYQTSKKGYVNNTDEDYKQDDKNEKYDDKDNEQELTTKDTTNKVYKNNNYDNKKANKTYKNQKHYKSKDKTNKQNYYN